MFDITEISAEDYKRYEITGKILWKS
jgi:hypothetical protein